MLDCLGDTTSCSEDGVRAMSGCLEGSTRVSSFQAKESAAAAAYGSWWFDVGGVGEPLTEPCCDAVTGGDNGIEGGTIEGALAGADA